MFISVFLQKPFQFIIFGTYYVLNENKIKCVYLILILLNFCSIIIETKNFLSFYIYRLIYLISFIFFSEVLPKKITMAEYYKLVGKESSEDGEDNSSQTSHSSSSSASSEN